MCIQYKSFENIVGKGENTCNEQFLLFPVFFTLLENSLPISFNSKLLSAKSFSLEESKCVIWERVNMTYTFGRPPINPVNPGAETTKRTKFTIFFLHVKFFSIYFFLKNTTIVKLYQSCVFN